MGRLKLFHTEEEKLRAKRASGQKYYAKNRAEISLKNRERYRKKRETREPSGRASPDLSYARVRCMSPSPEPSSATIKRLETVLMSLVSDSLADFLELIIRDIICTSTKSAWFLLTRTTEDAQELLTHAGVLHEKALQVGECVELRNLERTQDRITCVFHALDEVLLLARSNTRGLVRSHQRRELYYQTHSNIVPIM